MNSKRYIIAVDVGGTKTNIGYFINGKLTKVTKFPTKKYGPENIDTILEILHSSKKKFSAICLSLTGLINKKGLWNPINKKTLGDFKNYPVIKILKDKLGVPVYALGDTQAAALGELYFGNAKGLKNFFYLTISTGVGGSIIYNQKLFDNKVSDIGSIGHTVIKHNGRLCGCGKKGCLEAYVSGNALIRQTNLKKCKSTKDLLTRYKNNLHTKKIVSDAASLLAESIINIYLLIRVNSFIIGGSVGLNSFFYNTIQNKLKDNKNPIRLKKAKLKSKAELFGCFIYVKKKFY